MTNLRDIALSRNIATELDERIETFNQSCMIRAHLRVRDTIADFLDLTKLYIEKDAMTKRADSSFKTYKIDPSFVLFLGLDPSIKNVQNGSLSYLWRDFVQWGTNEGLNVRAVWNHDGMGYESWYQINIDVI